MSNDVNTAYDGASIRAVNPLEAEVDRLVPMELANQSSFCGTVLRATRDSTLTRMIRLLKGAPLGLTD
jgi:hypothetical protein